MMRLIIRSGRCQPFFFVEHIDLFYLCEVKLWQYLSPLHRSQITAIPQITLGIPAILKQGIVIPFILVYILFRSDFLQDGCLLFFFLYGLELGQYLVSLCPLSLKSARSLLVQESLFRDLFSFAKQCVISLHFLLVVLVFATIYILALLFVLRVLRMLQSHRGPNIFILFLNIYRVMMLYYFLEPLLLDRFVLNTISDLFGTCILTPRFTPMLFLSQKHMRVREYILSIPLNVIEIRHAQGITNNFLSKRLTLVARSRFWNISIIRKWPAVLF